MCKIYTTEKMNKIFRYLLLVLLAIPIVGLIFLSIFSPALRSWLSKSAQDLIDKSKKKNEDLNKDIEKIKNDVAKIDLKDQDLKNKINEVETDSDSDWHKKGNK